MKAINNFQVIGEVLEIVDKIFPSFTQLSQARW
jgi:hypothetical protein